MKKTVSVNIKGLNFLIEEDAYESLQNYLDRLEAKLSNEKGGKDIIEDIELRIAELCSLRLNDKKQVIELSDIEEILSTLGDPSLFVDESEESGEYQSQNASAKSEKRLFRDTDNEMIGGICAGIANYTNVDIVIIRAIFVGFFFMGFGFPLYIVLWIITPKANTTIDKLRMQGKPITVESVKEEIEMAADRISKGSKKFAQRVKKDGTMQENFRSIGRLFSLVFGLGLISMGLVFLITFLIFIIGGFQFIPVQSEAGFLSMTQFAELVVDSGSDITWGWIGLLTLSLSSILFLLLAGFKLVFRIHNFWSKLSLISLFISGVIGMCICIVVGFRVGREMASEAELEKELASVSATELVIETMVPETIKTNSYAIKSKGKYGLVSIEDDRIVESGIKVRYKISSDSLFHIYLNKTAHSFSHDDALLKAENIRYDIKMDSNKLILDSHYYYPKKDKLRDQDVTIIIEVPEGANVKWKNNLLLKDKNDEPEDEYLHEYGYIDSRGDYEHDR